MTAAISIASVLSIAIYVVLFILVGAWPIVAIGAFASLVVVCGVAWAQWDGAP